MMNRSRTQKDIRSRIKHENARLGAGTEMGGVPNNHGLNNNVFQPQSQQPQLPQQAQRYPHVQPQGQQDNNYGAGPSAYPVHSHHQHSASSASLHTGIHQGAPIHPQVAQHQAHPLGAGPSFVSLSPSDSISNFEGRPGNAYHGGGGGGSGAFNGPPGSFGGQMYEPSAGSTASFAQALGNNAGGEDGSGGAHTPLRPARSGRRPQRMSMMSTASVTATSLRDGGGETSYNSQTAVTPVGRNLMLRSERGSGGGGSTSHDSSMTYTDGAHAISAADRHAKSARLMAQVNNPPDSGRETPNSMLSEEEGGAGGRDIGLLSAHRPGDDLHSASPTSPPLGSLTQQQKDKPKVAMESVLSALSQAGRKQGQARILRGTTAEEESRRRRTERKVEAAQSRETKPLEAYVDRADSRAFREIGAVLRKAKAEWDFVVDDDFNAVSLAFSLLDGSSLGASRTGFEEMKTLIERSLQGTVDDHYESFATAISLHNNVLSSLTASQGGVSGARRRLRDAREALGAKRADLVQLWHRSQTVKESLRLLDTIDNLKGVPDRVESLMAEKQFLEAVNLLSRALKACERTEIMEVGATSDLRAYLKGQEQAMFDILIEELHNHLYLKSYFCDARWKPYSSGQAKLPNVEFGRQYEDDEQDGQERRSSDADMDAGQDPRSPTPMSPSDNRADKPLKVFRYLRSLNSRPAPSNLVTGDLMDLGFTSSNAGASIIGGDMGMPRTTSVDSMMGGAGGATGNGNGVTNEADYQQQNPEADSFLYIEMLLESLAKLGKLKLTQEVILQRLPIEVHQLVDATIDEVAGRSEMLRRSSIAGVRLESLLLASSSALARSFAENARNSFRNSMPGAAAGHLPAGRSSTRMSTLDSSQVERDCETMRDLFWTLFSKLDAVLQGHRVVFEVVAKISSRGASSAYKAVKVGKPSSLTDVWRPIQAEVQSLLHEYLVDESEGTSARRDAIVSVNEILQQGSFHRDRSKTLFRLTEAGPRPGANLSRKDFAPLRRHEDAVTNALRASVPGLVGGGGGVGDGGMGASTAVAQQHRTIMQLQHPSSRLSSNDASESAVHKLLVKPDAFNISVLFQPTLVFIERVKVLLPPEAAGYGSGGGSGGGVAEGDGTVASGPIGGTGAPGTGFNRLLDDFLPDVFLSQLEDKVLSLFVTAVGAPGSGSGSGYRRRYAR